MLSSDKNVETIAQLIEVLKHYLGLQTEYVKLDVIDKVVRLLTAASLAIVFFLITVAVALYFSIALAFWLSTFIGTSWAFLLVGLIHLLIFILIVIFRKPWIEKPLVSFLATLLLSK
ncbi:MAG: phage holin family protein [Prevotella sp.]|nr:phage holin family protein [Prevotella sp.]